jgi:hypothetical protein
VREPNFRGPESASGRVNFAGQGGFAGAPRGVREEPACGRVRRRGWGWGGGGTNSRSARGELLIIGGGSVRRVGRP